MGRQNAEARIAAKEHSGVLNSIGGAEGRHAASPTARRQQDVGGDEALLKLPSAGQRIPDPAAADVGDSEPRGIGARSPYDVDGAAPGCAAEREEVLHRTVKGMRQRQCDRGVWYVVATLDRAD
ncbi:MAG: hypothetical protein HW416_859 [Chloroflexi bacterium]|nr:hypothetical protein [Chloroflexota bacterium]